QILASILTLIGTFGIMMVLSPLLTFVTMSIIPVLLISMRWITKRTGPLYKLQQSRLGELNGFEEETVSGHHTANTFSQEKRVIHAITETHNHVHHTRCWALTIAACIPEVMNMLNYVGLGLVGLVGGLLAINGAGGVTVGINVIFIDYARQFTRP